MTRSAAFAKRDANHAELVKLYRRLGCSVYETHATGFGFPDAVIGIAGLTELVEFKGPKGDLTPAQKTFRAEWRGGTVMIIRSPEDVVAHVQSVRRRLRDKPIVVESPF